MTMSHRERVQQDLDEADRRVRAGDVAGARKATRRAVDRVSGGRARAGKQEDVLATARESLKDESHLRHALGTNHAVTRAKGRSTTALYNSALGRSEGRARAQRRDAAVRASGGMALKAVRRAAKRISAASKKAWSRAKREFSGGV